MARDVVSKHNGVIPADMDALVKLAGVGRKTASVFLGTWHNIPAIAVDTHVMRVSRRLGFTTHNDPLRIERDLAKLFPQENWVRYHHYMVLFGRYYCKAQNPSCENCELKSKNCTYSIHL